MTCIRKGTSNSGLTVKIFTSLFFITSILFSSCVSSKIVISDEMMMPILDEEFEAMEDAIGENWSLKRKPSVIVFFCYDERFGENTVTVISNWIQSDLESRFVKSGNYKVIDKQNLDRILKEQKFQQSGYVDDKVMVDMGRELGGNYMVISKINQYNQFVAKISNIETAELIYTTTRQISKNAKVAR